MLTSLGCSEVLKETKSYFQSFSFAATTVITITITLASLIFAKTLTKRETHFINFFQLYIFKPG